MGHDSFFSIETIDKINKENIKGIKLKNEKMCIRDSFFANQRDICANLAHISLNDFRHRFA